MRGANHVWVFVDLHGGGGKYEEEEMDSGIFFALVGTTLTGSIMLARRVVRDRAVRIKTTEMNRPRYENPSLRLLRSEKEVYEALDRAIESELAVLRLSERRAQHYSMLRDQISPIDCESHVSPRLEDA